MRRVARLALILAIPVALAACTETKLRLSPDFGEAVSQDVKAQVADPDAHYAGTPDPASDGVRAAASQDRYQKDQVIRPASTSTSTSVAGGGGGGGASTGGGGPQ